MELGGNAQFSQRLIEQSCRFIEVKCVLGPNVEVDVVLQQRTQARSALAHDLSNVVFSQASATSE
jgi:hypothetical protein